MVADSNSACWTATGSSESDSWAVADLWVHALIDVSSYPAETEVPYFQSKVVCGKCGSRGNKIDVRPNWKEQPPSESLIGKDWR